MAPEDPSGGARPAPVVLRIKLRYDDVEVMIQRFAPNVGKSGLFLPTKSIQPLGAEIKFELRLADDTPVLVGLGKVKAVKEPDPTTPKAAFGMAIELMRVSREGRDLILKMLERRKALGLPEVAIPMPEDIAAARRSEVLDTGVRDSASSAIPSHMRTPDSSPVPTQIPSFESQPIPTVATVPDSSPVPAPVPSIDSGPESLLTAPRRPTGPFAVAKAAVTVAALAPEAPRKKRPMISELIESASGPISSMQVVVPGLDEDVDVAAVISRARTLAGGSLDAELEALREAAAAPLEINIEAASAELARQLGGAAVSRRDRSARWATPPSVSTPTQVEPEAPPPSVTTATAEGSGFVALSVSMSGSIAIADSRAEPVAVSQAPDEARIDEPPSPSELPSFMAHATHVDDVESSPVHMYAPASAEVVVTEPSHASIGQPLIDDDANPADFAEPEEVAPEQIADEIHQLSEDDFEEVEHTQLGDAPIEPSFEQHAYVTEPGVQERLERSLDAQLAEAEAEADAEDRALAAPAAPVELLAEQPAEQVAEQPPAEEEEISELDDFEILAEADADDADLLASHGEQDASGQYGHEAAIPADLDPVVEPPPRTSHSDFAARLDLGDDSELLYTPPPQEAPREFSGRHASFSELDHEGGELDPRIASAGHALAAFDEPDEPDQPDPASDRSQFDEPASYRPETDDPIGRDSDSAFTIAGDIPPDPIDFDSPHAGFSAPHAFDQSDVIIPSELPTPVEPYILRKAPQPQLQPATPEESYDLETALEALDVDLDDLSIPHAPTHLPTAKSARAASRQSGSARVIGPAPGRPVRLPRATSEDGIEIDFEDDDET